MGKVSGVPPIVASIVKRWMTSQTVLIYSLLVRSPEPRLRR